MSHVKERRADPDIEAVARENKRRTVQGAGGPSRRRLAVSPDHKTRSMKKGRRGTYP
jgi:hypothetical protein